MGFIKRIINPLGLRSSLNSLINFWCLAGLRGGLISAFKVDPIAGINGLLIAGFKASLADLNWLGSALTNAANEDYIGLFLLFLPFTPSLIPKRRLAKLLRPFYVDAASPSLRIDLEDITLLWFDMPPSWLGCDGKYCQNYYS